MAVLSDLATLVTRALKPPTLVASLTGLDGIGPSWTAHGPSSGPLGPLRRRLGDILGALGAVLGRLGGL